MAKAPLNGNLKYILYVVAGIVSLLSIYTTVVLGMGDVRSGVAQNTKDITENHEHGCKPSEQVRRDVAVMQAKMANYADDIAEIKEMQNKILTALTN